MEDINSPPSLLFMFYTLAQNCSNTSTPLTNLKNRTKLIVKHKEVMPCSKTTEMSRMSRDDSRMGENVERKG